MSSSSHNGHIKLVMGPMFSGKTTELMRLARRYKLADPGCRVLVVSHKADDRYKDADGLEITDDLSASFESVGVRSTVTSHEGRSMPSSAVGEVDEIMEAAKEYDVIAIDEGQFYPDLAEKCDQLAQDGKIVIVSGLDGDFKREPFHQMSLLISKADSIVKLLAICHYCRGEAPFTHRTVVSNSEVLIGGKDSYIPLCRNCFPKHSD